MSDYFQSLYTIVQWCHGSCDLLSCHLLISSKTFQNKISIPFSMFSSNLLVFQVFPAEAPWPLCPANRGEQMQTLAGDASVWHNTQVENNPLARLSAVKALIKDMCVSFIFHKTKKKICSHKTSTFWHAGKDEVDFWEDYCIHGEDSTHWAHINLGCWLTWWSRAHKLLLRNTGLSTFNPLVRNLIISGGWCQFLLSTFVLEIEGWGLLAIEC